MESETAFNDTTGFISLPKQKSDALPLTGEISTKAEITDSLGGHICLRDVFNKIMTVIQIKLSKTGLFIHFKVLFQASKQWK